MYKNIYIFLQVAQSKIGARVKMISSVGIHV